MSTIIAPSGLEAEILLPNGLGNDQKAAGLKYIGDHSKKRLREVFLNNQPMFDLMDIAADMNEFKFGYVDDVYVGWDQLESNFRHILPITSVSDDIPNCLWHADRLRIRMGEETEGILDPSAVTFLYADSVDPVRNKETGFGDPKLVADAYNTYFQHLGNDREPVSGEVASLRNAAETLGEGLLPVTDDEDWKKKFETVQRLLKFTYSELDRVLEQQQIQGMHWISQQKRRLMLFSNSIAHSNDLVRQDQSMQPRNQGIWRRMLPGRKFMQFNTGI